MGWLGELQYPSRLTADEQYTQMSLWSLLSAPLLMGCDVIALDDFTKSLLTNDELIDINQDPLGKQATPRVYGKNGLEIWTKEIEDGSHEKVYSTGMSNNKKIKVKLENDWIQKRAQIVRNIWKQKDEGIFDNSFSASVPAHGVKLITIRKSKLILLNSSIKI